MFYSAHNFSGGISKELMSSEVHIYPGCGVAFARAGQWGPLKKESDVKRSISCFFCSQHTVLDWPLIHFQDMNWSLMHIDGDPMGCTLKVDIS